MRSKKLLYNTVSSFVFQITTIICGFILPRLILSNFGTEINGLVNSITQFLGLISFLELGVGSVVQSSLYKPLAEKDEDSVSKIIASADKFFKKLGLILFVYVIILVIFYPIFVNQNFGFFYVAFLVIVLSISSFAQYLFGIVNRLLLTADQKGYIQYTVQTIAVILNTFACFALIYMGCGIHIVKLTTSLIYLMQPFLVYLYVKNHYRINRKIKYTVEPIKQKWNGIAQHVAAVILDSTDVVVLSTFATLTDVSIYSVYFFVVKGVKQLFLSMTNGITSLIGELWAKQEIENLKNLFGWIEWIIHTGTTYVFGVTAILIVPFVQVYTNGVNDANYIQPLFGILIVLANAGHCLRLPYNIMILAGGHYKQTQNNYIIVALLNIVVSVLAVKNFGLIGVTFGTLVAMLYQTVWMAYYNASNFIKWPFKNFIKQFMIDIVSFLMMYFATKIFVLHTVSYVGWILLAIEVSLVGLVITMFINWIFYKKYINKLYKGVRSKIGR
mgnify:FL=1